MGGKGTQAAQGALSTLQDVLIFRSATNGLILRGSEVLSSIPVKVSELQHLSISLHHTRAAFIFLKTEIAFWKCGLFSFFLLILMHGEKNSSDSSGKELWGLL